MAQLEPAGPDPDRPVEGAARLSFTVGEEDLATALGSGDVPVLATPRLIAWLEAATVAAAAPQLAAGRTTVGTTVEVDHVAASPVGAQVTASAVVRQSETRQLVFEVEAVHELDGAAPVVVAHGTVIRAVVDRARFLARAGVGPTAS
jgi:predicted thioesterase